MKSKYLSRLVAMAVATAVAGATTVSQPVYAEGEVGASSGVTTEPVVNETEQQSIETTTESAVTVVAEEPSIETTTGAEVSVNESDFDFDQYTGTITKYNGTASEVVVPSEIDGVSVTNIGRGAFRVNTWLTSMGIPDGIKSITLPDTLTSIEDGAFVLTRLERIDIPNSVTSIGDDAFGGCGFLKSVTLPNGITRIGNQVFNECTSLNNIIIPESVTSIGSYAFLNCFNLESINIPNSVTSIDDTAFQGCEKASYYVDSQEIKQQLINVGVAESRIIVNGQSFIFDSSTGTLVRYVGSDNTVVIPSTIDGVPVKTIGEMAFRDCSNLTGITIPDSITNIGGNAFSNCSSLSSITLPNSITSIGGDAFYGCSSLTSIDIPNSVTSMGIGVFVGCSNLTSVTLSNSITNIPDYTFWECSSLIDITIPDNITSIGEMAFGYCDNLANITIPNSVTSIGNNAFDYCNNARFYIESEQVEQLLINVGVEESKIILNGQPSTIGTQTAAELETEIISKLQYLHANNNTTDDDILNQVDSLVNVENEYLNLSIDDFILTPSNGTTTGSAVGAIVITDTANNDAKTQVSFNVGIEANAQTAAELETEIISDLQYLHAYNNTTADDILSQIDYLVDNEDLKLSIDGFILTPSTTTTTGSAVGAIVITDTANNDTKTQVSFNVGISLEQSAEALKEEINNQLENLGASNNATYSSIYNYIKGFVRNYDLAVRIDDFVVTPATGTTKGSVKGTIVIIDMANSNAETRFSFNKEISLGETAEQLKQQLTSSMEYFIPNNSTTEYTILNNINNYINNSDLTVRIDNFALTPATTTTAGSVECTIVIIDKGNSNAETKMEFSRVIDPLQTAEMFKQQIQNFMLNFHPSNTVTSRSILNSIGDTTNKNLKLRIDDFVVTPSTTTEVGIVTGKIVITDTANSNAEISIPFSKEIDKAETAEQLKEAINNYMQYIYVNNNTIDSDILDQIDYLVDNKDLTLRIDNFTLTPSTTTQKGTATGKIVIIDAGNSNEETSIPFNKEISLVKTVLQLKEAIYKQLGYLDANNNSTYEEILDRLNESVDNDNLKLRIDNFVLTPSTTTVAGSVKGKVVIIDTANSNAETSIPFYEVVSLMKTASQLKDAINNELEYMSHMAYMKYDIINNNTTESDILDRLSELVDNKDLKLRVDNFVLIPSTTTAEGSAKGTIVIVDTANSDSEISIPFNLNVNLAKTAAELKEYINEEMRYYIEVDNETAKDDILDELSYLVDNKDLTLRIDNFALTKSTTIAEGFATGTIVITDTSNSNAETLVTFKKEIPKLSSNSGSTTDGTTGGTNGGSTDGTSGGTTGGTNEGSTDGTTGGTTGGTNGGSTDGSAGGTTGGTNGGSTDGSTGGTTGGTNGGSTDGTVGGTTGGTNGGSTDGTSGGTTGGTNGGSTDSTNGNTTGETVSPLIEDTKAIINTYLNSYVPSNSITSADVKSRLESALNDERVTISITNFNLTSSNYSNTGLCSFDVVLSAEGNTTTIQYSNEISRLVSTSSSHSSSHSNSNSNSTTTSASTQTAATDSKTTGAGTQSTGTGVVAQTGTVTGTTTVTPINKEAVREQVVSTLSEVVGTGATVEQTKEVKTTDGSIVSVSKVVSDGSYTGSVITADKSSGTVTIPIETDGAKVEAVYKYVPLLDKYIQVTDAVIGQDAITLPAQANATYLAATAPLVTTETITEGWAQVNNNWYLLSSTGDLKTGWQQDGTGKWTYLDQSTGVMATGWYKDGQAWYHLGDNGYMTTGWVKTGDSWYYLNQDGSMAHDTTVNGYKLGSNGAWES